jgi:hypothetical protein
VRGPVTDPVIGPAVGPVVGTEKISLIVESIDSGQM